MAGDEVRDIRMPEELPASGLFILVDSPACAFDIVFVHGFTGHPYRTWKHKTAVAESSQNFEDEAEEPPRKIQKIFNSSKSRLPKTQPPKPVYWPTDLLPRIAPNARILTYGYDTHVRHVVGPPISSKTVYDIAGDLMTSLEAVRRSHPSRPLLFIAHSLGGIVVKEMLRQSGRQTIYQTHLLSISNSTAGVLFFGTPHGGADPGGLVRSIAESTARLLQWKVNEKVLDTLLPSSERLKQLRDEFGPIAHEKKWIIHCFQEEYPVKGLNGKRFRSSKIQHLASTTLLSRPFNTLRDHMEMCRFSGINDPEYTKVAAAIERVLASASNRTFADNDIILDEQQRRKYLEHLKFDQIDARHATIKTPHAKTCRWLLTRPEYQDWLDPTKSTEHSGFLWIKGKPGTGKSTIMKYAFTQARKTMTDANHISFFFNARGEQLEKTTLGMYRSLLLQLLDALPSLHIALNKTLAPQLSTAGKEISWNLEEVKAVFQAAVSGLGDRKVVCFIDALDECEEDDVRDMISFFEQVCEKAVDSPNQFFVCFSSRHYPHIAIAKCIELVLEGQAGHQEDLAKYLDSELKIGSSRRSQDIKEEILNRSSGIFLWVVLVVQILKVEYDRGQVHALRKRLDEIPNGLHELFRDIITRDGRNVDELILCLQWILYAKRPLKCEELYFAVLTGVDINSVSWWDRDETTTADMGRFILDRSKGLAELTKTKDQTVQFIHESVRDFLFKENSLGQFQCGEPGLTDNFAGISHDRLKECCQAYLGILLSESIFIEELPAAKSEKSVEMRQTMCEKWPLLDYAVKYIFEHADAAGQHEVSQDLYLERLLIPVHPYWETFNRSSWIYLNNILEPHHVRRYTSEASFLYIFTDKSLTSLIRTVLKETPNMDIAGERHRFPLNAALTQGNEDAIREFLRPAAALLPADRSPSFAQSSTTNGDQVDVAKLLLQKARNITSFKHSVFAWAVAHAQQNTIACLIATGKVDLNIDFKTPDQKMSYHVSLIVEDAQLVSLEIYMRGSHVRYSRLLSESVRISKGLWRLLWACYLMQTVFNIQDQPLKVPLKVLFDEAGVIEFLIHDRGLDPNRCGAADTTCLIFAAKLGLKSQLEFLLEQNSLDVNAADSMGKTALHYAAEKKHGDIVGMLLGQPILDVNKQTKGGWTALHGAVADGHANIVRMLLGHPNLDINQRNNHGETALYIAVRNDHEGIVGILLGHPNLDPNQRNNDGETALHITVQHGHEGIVGMLLRRPSLDINQRNNDGKTALHIAVQNRNEGMVRTLLEQPNLDMNQRNNDGETALHIAVLLGQLGALKILLEQENFITIGGTETGAETTNPATNNGDTGSLNQNINANVTNPWLSLSGTDLARTENLAQMPTLNRRRIDVNATDHLGRTALHLAVNENHPGMVEMLLERDDINIHIADKDGVIPLEAGRRQRSQRHRMTEDEYFYPESERLATAKIVAMLERRMSRGMIGTGA
ncbi:hypothetical protein LTR20_007706 [Exophiala xenobiotica]|nr:hypothetical protein LTS13_007147 [Exophiala xenobiotica]KAK5394689.1 hypothetical protein LTR79_008142 [Exophiala xenobiotica]KAK5409736.1 hypothetical protein LTR90_008927 [Exophiala xenobiotica]KAK5459037.1 hypothetical protein LTR20_007706 [Exophiala xenobiotica]KAK5475178.1 hypothetical protein LTR26_009513 [Exophiala xenobiotica]